MSLRDYIEEKYPNFFEEHKYQLWEDVIIELIEKIENRNNVNIDVNYNNLDNKIERKVEEVVNRRIKEIVNNIGKIGHFK